MNSSVKKKPAKPVKAKVVKLPVKSAPKLKRLVKRGVLIYDVSEKDVRHYYVGYKQGAFAAQIEGTDMTPKEFQAEFVRLLKNFTHFFTAHRGDDVPLSLGLGIMKDHNVMEIHNIWMPWASARNKLECTVSFYREYNKFYTLITSFFEDALPFYRHIRKYGVVREVGEIRNFDGDKTAYLYQGVRQ